MNVSKNFVAQAQEDAAWRASVTEGLHDLKIYLLSTKFHDDPTVQTKDVLNRISEIIYGATQ